MIRFKSIAYQGRAWVKIIPGISLHLMFLYTKNELAMCFGYLFVTAVIAGALGGLLAFGISQIDKMRSMSRWRVSSVNFYATIVVKGLTSKQWIIIIIDILTVVLRTTIFFVLLNHVKTAYFFDVMDKDLMAICRNRSHENTASAQEPSKKDRWKLPKTRRS